MSTHPSGTNRQPVLIARSKRTTIVLPDDHILVRMTETLDWNKMEEAAQQIRVSKLKNAAGRPPHLRALLGALLLMAIRKLTYREAEDMIRYYVPARYLCGLTETDWTPDFTTIQDFSELMGEEGIKVINQYVVALAVEKKLADPKTMVADMTAQEAAIPYPNEMGLMGGFLQSVATAGRKAGQALKDFVQKTSAIFKAAKQKVRTYRLFAKTAESKKGLMAQMSRLVEKLNDQLGKALETAAARGQRLHKHAIVAKAKLVQLHQTMKSLLPQIRSWLRTGVVATGKIISLHIPQLYSIVRGKVGKAVEFGLSWGISRLRGGYLLGTLDRDRCQMKDSKFVLRAVQDHIKLFGLAPRSYAYDRGGYSAQNIAALKALGVKEVALAPRGKSRWAVNGPVKDRLVKERAQVEGGIGSLKGSRYGFNRPSGRSVAMMGACGQRAFLGFNLNKLVRELWVEKKVELVG